MKLIKMTELMSLIESFGETHKAKFELYKKESMRILITRDKKELENQKREMKLETLRLKQLLKEQKEKK